MPRCKAGGLGGTGLAGFSLAESEQVGGFPSVPSSFRFGPARQGRSFVASLRDGLRPPLTDRPEPESRKTAGKPPKERSRGKRGTPASSATRRGAGGRFAPSAPPDAQRPPRATPRRVRSLRAPPGMASDDRLGPIPAREDDQSSPGGVQARQIATRSSRLGVRRPAGADARSGGQWAHEREVRGPGRRPGHRRGRRRGPVLPSDHGG
ncbi:hypothetical protein EF910_07245 [Streptomyces sp. WAC07149]|nr:hypothetical protein EF910_07245 [Streptomyces sp. WAC07149]